MTPSVVLSRVPPCDVPQGYASVVPLPVALLGCHFEHPASEPDEEGVIPLPRGPLVHIIWQVSPHQLP
jgi:hypothetical protein